MAPEALARVQTRVRLQHEMVPLLRVDAGARPRRTPAFPRLAPLPVSPARRPASHARIAWILVAACADVPGVRVRSSAGLGEAGAASSLRGDAPPLPGRDAMRSRDARWIAAAFRARDTPQRGCAAAGAA